MSKDELEISELIETWFNATAAGENEQVLALMAEDVVFLSPGKPAMQGKQAFTFAQADLKDYTLEAKYEIQEIKASGNLGYCWNQLKVFITPKAGGISVKRVGNALSILEKQNGKWVITRDANMLVTAE